MDVIGYFRNKLILLNWFLKKTMLLWSISTVFVSKLKSVLGLPYVAVLLLTVWLYFFACYLIWEGQM